MSNSEMTVTTNNHPRYLKYRNEVPESVLEDIFDYLDDDNLDGFFKYRGWWYHLSGFMRVEPDGELEKAGWSGIYVDSMFSAVLIKLLDDEQIVVGMAYS